MSVKKKTKRSTLTANSLTWQTGMFTGQKNIAVERAGVYVPAGRFPLVSSVVMTVTPALAAGVKEIVLCTPPRVHPDDLEKAGISENVTKLECTVYHKKFAAQKNEYAYYSERISCDF